MADLPTRQDLFRVGRTAALAVPGGPIPASEFDRAGSNANLLLALSSVQGEEVIREVARALRDLLIDTAVGEGLDRLVFDRYELLRKSAARAVGTLNLSRTLVTGGSGTVPIGTRAQTSAGVQFETTEAVGFGPSTLTGTVAVRALVAGLSGNVSAGSVVSFVDPPFDTSIAVTNATVMAGGADQEADEAFRRRAKQFLPTLRRGILAAIEFGAKSVPGVHVARAIETLTPTGFQTGLVDLYVLDASGASNVSLLQLVRDELLEFRAAGINVVAANGAVVLQAISLVLAFTAGVATRTVADRVRNTVVAVVNDLNIGEVLRVSRIVSAAHTIAGVASTVVTDPVGDVVPSASQAVRTSFALVTVA